MAKLNEILKLITPTLTGLVLYFIIAIIILVINAHYLKPLITNASNGQHTATFGTHINSFLIWTNKEMLSHLGFNTSINLVVGIIWGIVGLVTYILCVIIFEFIKRLIEIYKLKKYVIPTGASRFKLIANPLERLLFQLFMTIVLFFYTIKLVLPVIFGHIVSVPDTRKINPLSNILIIGLYILTLHGFILALRLVFLKERLGQETELTEKHNL